MKVSICGCGWLGFPLAKKLVQQGHFVFGSKQNPLKVSHLKEYGIHGVALTLPVELNEVDSDLEEFLTADILIINVPPGRGEGADQAFIAKIKSLSYVAKKYGCRKVIFISTTSVYGSVTGVANEETVPVPDTASGHAHLQLEQWLAQEWGRELVVLRLAGLFGPGRHPVRYLAGRSSLANGSDPVNLVHLDDCLCAISQIVANWPSQQVLHLAARSHPSRESYYTAMALWAKLPVPEFSSVSGSGGKVVDASHTCEVLAMAMKYPDLMSVEPEIAAIN
ncbi:NAD-dependent epimerase/dehydratase family protein [uncultured Photobacterium sp.]|uniref:NAD-dependent epimerase/dehydratase family protein n=1 Tax=uncultured Photobacterium sp. TaxID=173973 RepID=UPI0026237839|nr:NAD-dependent epimerase/dehydratase family protein [uncultured Photobacterium sp.]